VCDFRTLSIGALRQDQQLIVVHRGLVAIACGLCGARGPIISTEAVRLALLRRFILFERENWLAGLIQHITQQFAGRQDTTGRDDVLFVLIFKIGGFAHQFQCVVNILVSERDPARHRALRALKAEIKFEAMKETQQMLNSVQGAFHEKLTDLTVRVAQLEKQDDPKAPVISLPKSAQNRLDGKSPS